jgi:hypothetical protein
LKLILQIIRLQVRIRVELLPGFKFTGKMVKIIEFTGKIGKAGKW